MLVTTRAMARRQLEEEITRREKEAVSGATPTPIGETSTLQGNVTTKITKDERRTLNRELGKARLQQQQPGGALNISTEELGELQEQVHSLADIRKVASTDDNDETSEFFWKNGLLYRRWKGHLMSSQTTYAPHVPNLAQFFHIYWSSYEFTFPNFVCS